MPIVSTQYERHDSIISWYSSGRVRVYTKLKHFLLIIYLPVCPLREAVFYLMHHRTPRV